MHGFRLETGWSSETYLPFEFESLDQLYNFLKEAEQEYNLGKMIPFELPVSIRSRWPVCDTFLYCVGLLEAIEWCENAMQSRAKNLKV